MREGWAGVGGQELALVKGRGGTQAAVQVPEQGRWCWRWAQVMAQVTAQAQARGRGVDGAGAGSWTAGGSTGHEAKVAHRAASLFQFDVQLNVARRAISSPPTRYSSCPHLILEIETTFFINVSEHCRSEHLGG